MAKEFDPYHQWLGIRDPQRPPNHYRLLGLEMFEDDADVIQNAADARMGHVRTYQTGPHSKTSQQILNELSSAKLTLLNAKKKAEYDAQLRTQQAAELPPPPVAAPPVAIPTAIPTAIPVAKPVSSGSTISKASGPGSTISKATKVGSGVGKKAPTAKPVSMPGKPAEPLVAQLVDDDEGFSINEADAFLAKAETQEDSVDLAVKQLSTGSEPQGASRYVNRRKQNAWMMPAAFAGIALVAVAVAWVALNSGNNGDVAVVEPPKKDDQIEDKQDDAKKGGPDVQFPDRPKRKDDAKGPRPFQPPQPPVPQPPVRPDNPPGPRTVVANNESRRLEAGGSPVVAVSFNQGRPHAITTDRFSIWDAEGNTERSDPLEGRIRAAVMLPQGLLAVAQDSTVIFVSWRGEKKLISPGNQGLVINRVFASANGKRALGTGVERAAAEGSPARQVAMVWEVETGALVRRLSHPVGVMAAALSPDGSRAFTATGDKALRLWDLTSSSNEPATLEQEEDRTYATAGVFSRDGKQLFTFGFNKSATVWDVETAREVRGFATGHQAFTAEISPDGKCLATGGYDHAVHVYDLKGNEIGQGGGFDAAVSTVGFSADGRVLIAGSNDRSVRVWRMARLAPSYQPGESIEAPDSPTAPTVVQQPDMPVQPQPPVVAEKKSGELGEPVSPVDLFARVYYSPDALRAEVEAIPKPKGTPAVPPRELPKLLAELVAEPLPAPAPLIDDKALALFNGTYEARIAAVDKTREDSDDFALAKELRELAVTQRDNPGLARYALLRAFGLASNGKGDVDLAEKIAESFDLLTNNPEEDVKLACLVARMNLLPEVQKVLRRVPSKRDVANGLNDHIIAANAAVADWLIDAHHYNEAKSLVSAITSKVTLAKDAELKNLPKTLREKITESEKRMNECLKLVAAVEGDPDAPKACEDLGLFYLGELQNLALAAPLLAKSTNDSLTGIAKAYEAAPKDPKQYFTLAQQLDGYAQTLGTRSTTQTLKGSALRLAQAAVQEYVQVASLTDSERGQGNLLLTSLTKQVEQLPPPSIVGIPRPRVQRDSLEIPVGNNAVLRFKLIPKGKFTMGDPAEPPAFMQQVELTQPYYLGLTEVTQAQWEAVMGNNPSRNQQGGDFPVEGVNYEDVQAFITTINSRFNGKFRFRLPTEAEWEYACRAGSNGRYSCGNDRQVLMQYAAFSANSNNESQRVGTRRPNAFGLYDMHGNLWEWVDGWYQSREPNQAPVKDPRGPEEGRYRTMRGGSFSDSDPHAGLRRRDESFNRDRRVGFRLAVDAG